MTYGANKNLTNDSHFDAYSSAVTIGNHELADHVANFTMEQQGFGGGVVGGFARSGCGR